MKKSLIVANEYDGCDIQDYDITDLKFNSDQRFREVQKMLCSSRVVTLPTTRRPEMRYYLLTDFSFSFFHLKPIIYFFVSSDHDFFAQQQQDLLNLSERTISLSIGRGMMTYASSTSFSSQLTIPKIVKLIAFFIFI